MTNDPERDFTPEPQAHEPNRVHLGKAPADTWADAAARASRSAGAPGTPPPGVTWANVQPGEPTHDPVVVNDVANKRVIAGVLGIILGSFGVHKFFIGANTAGLIMLLVNLGGWFVTFFLSLLTLGFGAILLVPLMGLVSTAIAVIGLVEGVLYLTKSDADFQREYLVGKKPWF
ncbi:TM2 domain-containing protein [Deinococcus maricopensis]|uniref:TM2 domain containing protein n=1 Tax=Deinococcus maricopensis (strain DSM 21211 / LMG 22137 / NRRL B-23946 / LB-34) TaxID=709986 RepID=E8UBR1_DEIML|nr:TM2 domain-containing protein [Deinococcus maricopensis]ADV68500.1 TM2 domain containing protein [Deinococcus maricopensis DSM 21211]